MMRMGWMVLAGLVVAGPALAAERTTEAFYAEATALKAKGAMALFSGRIGPLVKEGNAAGELLRQQRAAAIARGQQPAYCPPANPRMSNDEMMAGLSRIPQPERARLPLSQGMLKVLAAKWPCR